MKKGITLLACLLCATSISAQESNSNGLEVWFDQPTTLKDNKLKSKRL